MEPNKAVARLEKKVAVLTGGAGGIGKVIAQRYLEEGASVILTGRNPEKLKAAVIELGSAHPSFKHRIFGVAMDGSNPESLRKGVAEIQEKFPQVHILINNAGSAGPRQELANIPLNPEDLRRLRATGSQDTETLQDAVGSLLGSAWYTTQTFLPIFAKGASVINVSTIFSRTEYYGRTAYVVPKAALNVLTKCMARELGQDARGIRVNTVYPGPVESERIHSVFASMDQLKGVEPGTTRHDVVSAMLLQNSPTGSNYLSKEEVASTIVFLGSDESTSFSGHDFEVTHGLQPPTDSTTDVISRPNLRVVDLEGRLTWILAGDQFEEACALAEKHHEVGSDIFLTFRDEATLEKARAIYEQKPGYFLGLLDPLNPEHWHKADTTLYLRHQLPRSVIVLPAFGSVNGNSYYGDSVMKAPTNVIQNFFDREICGAITIAQRLDQLLKAADKRLTSDVMVLFMTNGSDKKGNHFAEIRSTAIRQLIRTWRHENKLVVQSGKRTHRIRLNQIVRYENEEEINQDLACEWALSLSNGLRQVRDIDIRLSPNLAGSIQSRAPMNWERQALRGLHLRKVALITGGSEGIGRETARLLAISGARVVIAARDKDKLDRARQNLIEELKMAGYSEPESRILIIPDCDVADPKALEQMIEQTLARFGRIDYLINNAGISGVEQMVADMPLDGWQRTQMANLISNYDLITRALPTMKKQKSGHILNVSSHFGGVRHATVPYPNRSDYAVSKAGQRAMAEVLASFLGPDVQINAVAPGPVDGIRLRGTNERPGLYARRAKLILENKRMNLVYGAMVTAARCGDDLDEAFEHLAKNKIETLLKNSKVPASLAVLAKSLTAKPSKDFSGSDTYLLTKPLAEKLIRRLKLGKYLPEKFSEENFFEKFIEPKEPFFSISQINSDAEKIKSDVLRTLALQRMPSETDVGREMVFYLANKNVTGETLHPSCGLTLEKLTMSGDFVGGVSREMLGQLKGEKIYLVGDTMYEDMAKLARLYLNQCDAKKVTVLVGSNEGVLEITKHLKKENANPKLVIDFIDKTALDRGLSSALGKYKKPDVIVSFPMGDLKETLKPTGTNKHKLAQAWESLPSVDCFKKLLDEQVTNHLVLGRRGTLIDQCRIIFVTPRIETTELLTQAFANFIRTTLRPLTVTAGQEASRLIHKPVFHQVDGGSNINTSTAELDRFMEAILLLSLPPQSNTGERVVTRPSSATTITV